MFIMTKTKTNKLARFKGGVVRRFAPVAILGATAASASAQVTNQGAAQIASAIDGLKPDVSLIIAAAIGLGILVVGAAMAFRVMKKFMG